MRIRTKILSSHAVLATAVALICIVIIFTLGVADVNRRQLSASYEQLRNIDLIATEANHYIEQIAELIIIGPQDTDIYHAREMLRKHLTLQRTLVANELDWLEDQEDRAGETVELTLIDQIETVLNGLDQVYEQLATELEAGRRDQADALYRDEVENRLDDELGRLVTQALEREMHEVEHILAESARLSRQSVWLAIGVILIVTALGAGNVVMLNRTVLRPVTALADAADAVGRGDLSHIVSTGSADELGNLAQRFNRMTSQIREQRDALHRTNEDLEAEVTERTAELLARSEEMEAVNARLREIDANRAEFFADISHELRTPLTVLRGQAEVALRRRDADPEPLRQTLEAIVRKAGQMGRLVEDMLFLARSENDSLLVEMQTVILQEVVADALLDTRTLARSKGIILAPQQPIDPVTMLGDADRLRQAMVIALDNAIKFAPEGSTVAITLDSGGGRALVGVRDQGQGFSEENTDRAFKRFYRSNGKHERTGRGAGLGLAIAKWIIERHAGEVRIESIPGSGATVIFDLPCSLETS